MAQPFVQRRRHRCIAVAAGSAVPVERMEQRVLLSFTPYVSGGWTATPGYQFLNAKTGATGTAAPLGSTSPLGAPIIPATMRDAYGLGTYTATANSSSVTGYNYTYNDGVTFNGIKGDGTGQTIAIVDVGSDPDIATDLQTFDTAWDLPAPPSFQQLSQTGSSTDLPAVDPGWPGEISLDVEWSHVMAPGANIILFAASDLYTAVQYAASYPGVSVVSMSFTVGGNAPDTDFVTPSGHTGVSFFAGNGDTGAEVPSPAQSVNVVAVGGTSLTVNSSGKYNNESTWSAGGGGTSGSETQPTFQTGIVSAYSTTQRTTPDVSMDANPGTGVAIVDSYDSGSGTPWELIIGGTSLATPLTAGTIAVADQARVAEGLTAMDGGTQLLPRLYELYQANEAANFNDITTGSNGHRATVGYDEATGLGSLKANNLIPDIAGGDTVSGRAFIDNNGNGTYDAGTDTPLANKTVYLDLNNSGEQTAQDPTTTTNASGGYVFSDVIGSATGTVRLVGSSGYVQENNGTFTTAYDSSQTYNLVFASTTTYTATTSLSTTTSKASLGVTIGGTPAAGLVYTWSVGSGPENAPAATFSPNGTAAAQNTTVTFEEAGTYVLVARITNSAGDVGTTSVTITVTQVLTSLAVAAVPPGVGGGHTVQLSATGNDQFGYAMATTPVVTWSSVSGGGLVSPTGVLTAPAAGGVVTVKAASASISANGTVDTVPLPWTPADVGTVGSDGTALGTATGTTLTVASDDIWEESDDMLFDYQELANPGTGTLTVVAEIDSETSASGYVKAGVMIRNSLNTDDVMGMECDPENNGPLFEWRTSTTTIAAQDATSGASPPEWVQVQLSNGTMTGYSSTNGTTWTETGSQALSFGTDVYVGLALSSHNASDLATAVFSNIAVISNQTLSKVALITPTPVNLTSGQSQQLIAAGYDQNGFLMSNQPAFTFALNSGSGTLTAGGLYNATAGTQATYTATAGGLSVAGQIDVVNSPWTSTDIGTVNAPGTAYDTGTGTATTTTITDTSDDIWNESDDFHFDYQTITGNGSITAELDSQTTTGGNFTKAGLMIRNSLNPDDTMVMVFDAPNGAPFEWRTAAGTDSTQVATSTNYGTPYWYRLVRSGSTFTGYSSPNGTTWTQLGTVTLTMNPTVYIGLALTSHSTTTGASAVFNNVTISNPTVATAAAASPSPATGRTAALSVLGANTPNPSGASSLTYTWAATNVPAGATTPAFSPNGTNAADDTTVTFAAAGSYTFTATIADALGDTTTSVVSLVVNQTLTSIAVSPTTAALHENATQAFTAVGYDQFGVVMLTQPTFTFAKTAGVGSINGSTGVYTSATTTGTATVQASSGSVAGTASVTVTNAAPVIAAAAAASPSTVAGNNSSLSVAATDDGGAGNLTYTWAETAGPVGAPLPTFTPNGTTAANSSIVTFYQAGSYTLTVTVTDSGGLTASSTEAVTVAQTLTSIAVFPTSAPLHENGTQTFTAVADDQFGKPLSSQPTFTWTKAAGIGSINAGTGLYTAPAAAGSATVQASTGSVAGTASVTVTNAAPVIAMISASPSTVSGNTSSLAVAATDDGGPTNLTYSWTETAGPAGARVPTFTPNGSNAAATATVTFYQAGSYTLNVTVTDSGGLTATGTEAVTVVQTLTAVTFPTPVVAGGGTEQASAVDQFGNLFLAAVGYSDTGGGNISSTGLFTAGQSGGSYAITASAGAASATTGLTVVPTIYTGPVGADNYAVRLSPTNPAVEQIFVDALETGSPTYTIPIAQLPWLNFDPTGGNGSVTVDFSFGAPLPAGGIGYTGGPNPAAGGNALIIDGNSAGGLGFSVDGAHVTDTAATAAAIAYSDLRAIVFNLAGGSNTLTQLAQPSAAVTFDAGAGGNTLDVDGGSYTFSGDPQTTDGNLTVNDNAALNFTAQPAGNGIGALHLAALDLGPAATATVQNPDVPPDRQVMVLGGLLLGTGSTLNLGGNDMIIQGGSLPAVTAAVAAGYANGTWTGTGITSSAAAADPTHLTALGVIQNAAVDNPIFTSFDGQPSTTADVLVKYTYYGDANLDGTVDGSDYSLIDHGYSTPDATGWINGDFNYDGVIDGSDYSLIDNAFNNQGASLSPAAVGTAEAAPVNSQTAGTDAPGTEAAQAKTALAKAPLAKAAIAYAAGPAVADITNVPTVRPTGVSKQTAPPPVAVFAGASKAAAAIPIKARSSAITATPAAVANVAIPATAAAPSPFYTGPHKARHLPAADDLSDLVTSPLPR